MPIRNVNSLCLQWEISIVKEFVRLNWATRWFGHQPTLLNTKKMPDLRCAGLNWWSFLVRILVVMKLNALSSGKLALTRIFYENFFTGPHRAVVSPQSCLEAIERLLEFRMGL